MISLICEFKKHRSKGRKKERGKAIKRLVTLENNLMVTRGQGMGNGLNRGWGLKSALLMSTGTVCKC